MHLKKRVTFNEKEALKRALDLMAIQGHDGREW